MEEFVRKYMARLAGARQWDEAHASRLSAACEAIAKLRAPSKESHDARLGVLQRIGKALLAVYGPGLKLEPYGSFVSGLYTNSSDLDLALSGEVRLRDLPADCQERLQPLLPAGAAPESASLDVQLLDPESKNRLLKAVAKRLERQGLVAGHAQRILSARFPIIKFTERPSGMEVDLCVASHGQAFKAHVLRCLCAVDARLGQLYALVKLWARLHEINDGAGGTLNSWSLTLMVIFHLQTVEPAILPPLWRLFSDTAPPPDAPRLLQGDVDLAQALGIAKQRVQKAAGFGKANQSSLLSLFASFVARCAGMLAAWEEQPATSRIRDWRVCPWLGAGRTAPYRVKYLLLVEDPFDDGDNTARTVGSLAAHSSTYGFIREAMDTSAQLLNRLDSVATTATVFAWLFGPEGLMHVQQPLAAELGCSGEQWRAIYKALYGSAAERVDIKSLHEQMVQRLGAPACLSHGEWLAARKAQARADKAQAKRERREERRRQQQEEDRGSGSSGSSSSQQGKAAAKAGSANAAGSTALQDARPRRTSFDGATIGPKKAQQKLKRLSSDGASASRAAASTAPAAEPNAAAGPVATAAAARKHAPKSLANVPISFAARPRPQLEAAQAAATAAAAPKAGQPGNSNRGNITIDLPNSPLTSNPSSPHPPSPTKQQSPKFSTLEPLSSPGRLPPGRTASLLSSAGGPKGDGSSSGGAGQQSAPPLASSRASGATAVSATAAAPSGQFAAAFDFTTPARHAAGAAAAGSSGVPAKHFLFGAKPASGSSAPAAAEAPSQAAGGSRPAEEQEPPGVLRSSQPAASSRAGAGTAGPTAMPGTSRQGEQARQQQPQPQGKGTPAGASALAPQQAAVAERVASSSSASASSFSSQLPGVYVMNIPPGTTAAELEPIFAKFGPLRGPLQIVNTRMRFNAAYVDYESTEAVRAALRAKVRLGSQKLNVVQQQPGKERPAPGSDQAGDAEQELAAGRLALAQEQQHLLRLFAEAEPPGMVPRRQGGRAGHAAADSSQATASDAASATAALNSLLAGSGGGGSADAGKAEGWAFGGRPDAAAALPPALGRVAALAVGAEAQLLGRSSSMSKAQGQSWGKAPEVRAAEARLAAVEARSGELAGPLAVAAAAAAPGGGRGQASLKPEGKARLMRMLLGSSSTAPAADNQAAPLRVSTSGRHSGGGEAGPDSPHRSSLPLLSPIAGGPSGPNPLHASMTSASEATANAQEGGEQVELLAYSGRRPADVTTITAAAASAAAATLTSSAAPGKPPTGKPPTGRHRRAPTPDSDMPWVEWDGTEAEPRVVYRRSSSASAADPDTSSQASLQAETSMASLLRNPSFSLQGGASVRSLSERAANNAAADSASALALAAATAAPAIPNRPAAAPAAAGGGSGANAVIAELQLKLSMLQSSSGGGGSLQQQHGALQQQALQQQQQQQSDNLLASLTAMTQQQQNVGGAGNMHSGNMLWAGLPPPPQQVAPRSLPTAQALSALHMAAGQQPPMQLAQLLAAGGMGPGGASMGGNAVLLPPALAAFNPFPSALQQQQQQQTSSAGMFNAPQGSTQQQQLPRGGAGAPASAPADNADLLSNALAYLQQLSNSKAQQ